MTSTGAQSEAEIEQDDCLKKEVTKLRVRLRRREGKKIKLYCRKVSKIKKMLIDLKIFLL